MKRIILFFAVCLGLSVSQTTFADDAETVRAATKRTSGTTVVVSANSDSKRTVASNTKKSESTQQKNARTAVNPVQQRGENRTPVNPQTVKQRSAKKQPAPLTIENLNTSLSTTSRSATARGVNSRKTESNISATSRSAIKSKARTSARATELNAEKIDSIKSKDYSKCKTVYFECMDEFCANKDTDLRRCACSSRVHDFDKMKKQLNQAEDKLLDFNQRLLTVSLDKEDATAINVASEGELAYQKKDKSESEKLLKKITDTLNNSGDSRLNNNLSSISLSLDMDTAWDSVDAMGGVSTSAKEGIELYNAARPVCIEMAKEVCSDDELDIAQNSYKLTIQQDCNTVEKSYNTLYSQAQTKIHESSALLDMSRLNNYQQRNSDDILTCKKKILTQLSDASVCGENLYRCLDTTGQYINPATGKAFLSTNLYNLSSLLQEPSGDEKWSKVSQNENFVNFLNSKKEFLDPATEQCEQISDLVWKEFLDDALSQIKLAQNAKLEEIRQSCTTLVTECKSASLTDLSEFDARALSTFSVLADATANSMCKDVENSCVALMQNVDSSGLWESGISGISTDISYDTIIETCTNIGRDCIVQQCNGTSGNFALCKNTTDDKRADILMRNACWSEVYNCVAQADNLANMKYGILSGRENYYTSLYSDSEYDLNEIPEFCNSDEYRTDTAKKACLIAEQIWGNCEFAPDSFDITTVGNTNTHNKILTPTNGSTLLSWLAYNTNSTAANDSCNARGCPINYTKDETTGQCIEGMSSCVTTTDRNECIKNKNEIINVDNNITNYCEGGNIDMYGNCCSAGTTKDANGICVPNGYESVLLQTVTCNNTTTDSYLCPTKRTISVYCVHKSSGNGTKTGPAKQDILSSTGYYCLNGFWMLIDQNGNYFDMQLNEAQDPHPKMTYKTDTNDAKCTYKYNATDNKWEWTGSNCNMSSVPTENEFMISY